MAFNQKDYISKFNKDTYKMYQLRIKRGDKELIDKLDNVKNRNGYLTSLIENDVRPNVLTIKEIKTRIKPIMEKHGIKDVYLFGSYSRGEAKSSSDIDIYCSSGDIKSLYDEASFTEELKEALKKEVDVVFIGSQMHDYFKMQLEEDMIKIW